MIIDTVFESPERAFTPNRVSQLLLGHAGRQGFNEALHNAILVNIVFCRESQKSAPWRVFNQFLQFFITVPSNQLVLQINCFASLCIVKISKYLIGGLDCVNHLFQLDLHYKHLKSEICSSDNLTLDSASVLAQ